jgi:hypothetical protein
MSTKGAQPKSSLAEPRRLFCPGFLNTAATARLTATRHSTFHDRKASTRLLATLPPINCPRHHTGRGFHRTFSDLFARNSCRRISSLLRVSSRLHLPAHAAATIFSSISLPKSLASYLKSRSCQIYPSTFFFTASLVHSKKEIISARQPRTKNLKAHKHRTNHHGGSRSPREAAEGNAKGERPPRNLLWAGK